jgi:4'-phosphopantetheinyl transferase
MPLTDYIVTQAHARIGVWRIDEEEDYFLRKLPLNDREKSELELLKGHRRLEWLAARYLIQVMTGWAYSLVKDSFGKPFLHQSEYHISVSHSKDYTSAIIAPCLVGIDIQYITPKLERVAWRVMNDVKLKRLSKDNQLEHLHVYWGAKEALFKAYGKGELDFRLNIPIEPFDYENTEGYVKGAVDKNDFKKDFDIYYKKIEHYILVYAIEKLGLNQRSVLRNC